MIAADLDEAQEITGQALLDYMLSTGWVLAGSNLVRRSTSWTTVISRSLLGDNLGAALGLLIAAEKRSPQDVLRDINPRMRSGIPSEADRQQHLRKPWLARDEHGNLRTGFWWTAELPDDPPWRFYVIGRGYLTVDRVSGWSFWRCDANGNKLRGASR